MFNGLWGKNSDGGNNGGKDGGKKNDDIPNLPKEIPSSGNSAPVKSIHGFDPTALERAAKAAKELDGSKNSREALRVIALNETTKQKEQETERARFQVMQQELALKRVAEEEQSAMRTLDRQTQHDKERSNYRDELERKRMEDQMQMQRRIQDEERRKNEESLARQEQMRRKTLEHEATLRQQTEITKAKAEAEGRIMQERENHDLIMEKKRLEAKENRDTVLEGIKLATNTIGKGMQDFLTDRSKLTNLAVTLTGAAFGIYAARTTTAVLGRYIESRLGKPSLVRETTRKSVLQIVRSPYSTIKTYFTTTIADNSLKNIVLESSLENRLRRVAVSTSNTKRNSAPYRHLLLHGPPGTGKTMFAKGLARESGLDYAIMTGGDVAPLGKDAVTEIHKLFDWANTSKKGVLIFIDEADAFLRKRSTEHISEDLRNALNAFLYRTGEASHKFMVVYASNQPEQFDWAINDRIDEMVTFALPSYNERLRMLMQYLEIYLLNPPSGSKRITVEGVNEEVIHYIATETDGFSGREISKLAIAWQAAAYGTVNATIDKELIIKVLKENLESKRQKLAWNSVEELAKRLKIEDSSS